MKNKILLALILTPLFILFSQKQIVQEDIFLNHTFSQDWVFGLTSMNDGTHYTTLERAENISIDKYNYETGDLSDISWACLPKIFKIIDISSTTY